MADSFLKNGLVWAPSSVFVGPTNDGSDTTILPLEDVTGPPKQDYDIANIVAQWQPNLVVISVAPRGNQPMADTPLPRQDYRERENGIQWQQSWGAQRQAPVAAWNFADPIPRQDYRERENGIQWQVYWRAQAAAPNAAWNFVAADNPQPRQDYRQIGNGIQWQQSWGAQSAEPNASWNIAPAAADNPPPLKAYPQQVNAAWQPSLVLISLAPRSGDSIATADAPPPRQDYAQRANAVQWKSEWPAQHVAPIAGLITPAVQVDNPPRRALPRVDALWQVWWPAQSAPDNAAWNVAAATADNPPPLKAYPPQVNAAWQPNLVLISLAPRSGASVVAADAPQPRQDYAGPRIAALWQQDWRAQRAAPIAGLITPAAAQPDNPPLQRPYLSQLIAAHFGAGISITVRAASEGVVSVDEPPRLGHAWLTIVSGQWQQDWRAQRSALNASWNFTVAQVDNPPPRQQFGVRQVVAQWAQSWGAQKAAPVAGWAVPPAQVDNPPPRQLFGLREVVVQWQQSWGAQHAAPNAGWNFTLPDNPPPRQAFGVREIVAQWQQSWGAQHASPNAGWNFVVDNPPPRNTFALLQVCATWQQTWGAQSAEPNAGWNIPPIDNPPGRRPELSAGVHAAWIVSWKSQRAGPAVQEAPAVVPVYGWGARSKIGSSTGRDPWRRIGSSSASASDGKIGSEDA